MSREKERIKKQLENNPIEECNKIQKNIVQNFSIDLLEQITPKNWAKSLKNRK